MRSIVRDEPRLHRPTQRSPPPNTRITLRMWCYAYLHSIDSMCTSASTQSTGCFSKYDTLCGMTTQDRLAQATMVSDTEKTFQYFLCLFVWWLFMLILDSWSCEIIGRSKRELVIIAHELEAHESPSSSSTRWRSSKFRCNDDGLTFASFDDFTLKRKRKIKF